ncbi:YciC family protein [Marinobacter sp. ATCH36]|uniref:YciC family protein n=1 Tax=Marinobacter sp. ATCH36 TaxID=2945106 RepID=UPI002020A374|nr:YciC family protein [Marinobacter sp. ATCH36]MCL7942893.1 hypothetical protein [Marinobacter sp. ATCH36]
MTKTFLLDTWSFFRANFIAISLIMVPFTIPLEIFSFIYYQNMVGDEAGLASFLPVIVYALFYPIFGAAIVFYIASVINDRDITASQAWALGLKHWPSYFVLTVILILTIGFGFALFILPGLFLAARFAFSEFDLLLEKQDPLQSLRSSWESSREHFWILLNGGLIITFVIYAPYFLLASVLNEAGLYADILDPIVGIIESVLMVLYTIYAFRVYHYAFRQS